MPDEASDLGEFKQNLARPRRDAAVGRREKKYILFLVIWGFQKWCVQYPEPSKAKHVVVPILK